MNFEVLRVAIALVGTAILAYQDAKTSFMDERVLYFMLGAGVLFAFASFDFWFALLTLAGIAVVLGIGFLAYKTGQFGMGDVLLLAALHSLLPVFPVFLFSALSQASLFPPVFVILTLASVLGLIGSAGLYAYKLLKLKKKLDPNFYAAFFSLAACILLLFVIAQSKAPLGLIVIFAIVLFSIVFTFTFKRQVTRDVLIQNLKISEIEDEDILAIENLDEKIVKKYKLEKVLTQSQMQILRLIEKNEGVHVFPVYKHLPRFGPYILGALIIALLYEKAVKLLL